MIRTSSLATFQPSCQFSILIESHCHLSSKWTEDWRPLPRCSYERFHLPSTKTGQQFLLEYMSGRVEKPAYVACPHRTPVPHACKSRPHRTPASYARIARPLRTPTSHTRMARSHCTPASHARIIYRHLRKTKDWRLLPRYFYERFHLPSIKLGQCAREMYLKMQLVYSQ